MLILIVDFNFFPFLKQGITLEIIIQLFQNITPVLCIMLLVLIAFSMAFNVLLSAQVNEYFQDNFEGNITNKVDPSFGNFTVETANVSADNGFLNWFKAFSQVYFFIFGVWDPVMEGKAGDNMMLMALCIIFSIIIVLFFFNMVM